ncbi:tRNA pseudouridine synthase [Carpediemonas membranifera]|uniref:tRNA pseudouridine synthase n=1 Tax=Carpediemonas membranifera TaxID=201153 RepID=A0A8J6EBF3_9EUKA|nr:tRNA pseudouridine synthase [Carpediemonas membranifera]|eukprot:KAG9397045.1 tRNA pseudouridine synthase [Carpediemonas membranifera]
MDYRSAARKLPEATGGEKRKYYAMKSADKLDAPDESVSMGTKRMVAVMIGYVGTGYYGLQIQEGPDGLPTIEGEVFKALVAAGAVSEENAVSVHKIKWSRTARTDKGVHALRNILACKLVLSEDLVAAVNAHLPPAVRMFGYARTTKSFNAKNACCARTYNYVIPVSAFRPLGSAEEVKARWSAAEQGELPAALQWEGEWEFSDSTLALINDTLAGFVGFHKFHNYSSGIKFGQHQSTRNIISFTAAAPTVVNGVPVVVATVHGESFVYNQIRKMIGAMLAVVTARGPPSLLALSFKDHSIRVPLAPGEFLHLERCHFDHYHETLVGHPRLDFDDCDSAVEEFRANFIHPAMVQSAPVMEQFMTEMEDMFDEVAALARQEEAKDVKRATMARSVRLEPFEYLPSGDKARLRAEIELWSE